MYVWLGVLGFVLCGLFDYNQILWQKKPLNLLFPLGNLLILGATLWCALLGDLDFLRESWPFGTAVLCCGAVASLALLIYTLFFALPMDDTYLEAGEQSLVTTGVYGLCRHPGFWPFLSFYACLAGFLRSRPMGLCCLVFSICNFIYICLQDRYIFPRYIRGYGDYQKKVPFLVPTGESFRRAFGRTNKRR